MLAQLLKGKEREERASERANERASERERGGEAEVRREELRKIQKVPNDCRGRI